jgi:hypothetical protein
MSGFVRLTPLSYAQEALRRMVLSQSVAIALTLPGAEGAAPAADVLAAQEIAVPVLPALLPAPGQGQHSKQLGHDYRAHSSGKPVEWGHDTSSSASLVSAGNPPTGTSKNPS